MGKSDLDERRHKEDSLHQTVASGLVIRRGPLTKQKALKKKVKVSKADYTFLQYHHLIWKWALKNHNLKPRELNLLLYLQPIIAFTYRQFVEAQKDLGSSDAGAFKNMKDKGWVLRWSDNKGGGGAYYVLSSKANTLLNRMYRMYLLEEEIPMSPRRNVIVRKKSAENERLIGLFKKFNESVNEKRRQRKNQQS